LRRHAENLQSDPRPLIVMSPKSLLRHPRAASSLTELSEGRFYPVMLPETSLIGDEGVTRLILCSGKVYIDLITGVGRADAALPSTIAAARIEELYPFPANDIETLIRSYPNLHEVVWLQEEPQNMGAWNFVQNRLREILDRTISLTYCGRLESASTAEGLHSQHEPEQTRILREVVSNVLEHQFVLKR
jgi:2-oxoglutarate dehydrogenase E1 component